MIGKACKGRVRAETVTGVDDVSIIMHIHVVVYYFDYFPLSSLQERGTRPHLASDVHSRLIHVGYNYTNRLSTLWRPRLKYKLMR